MLTAGLIVSSAAALTGCGGAVSPPSSHPTASSTATVPATAGDAAAALLIFLRSASSVHVAGGYTWPHASMRVNVDLLKSGQVAGSILNSGSPMTVIDAGGKLYAKATPAFLRSIGKSAACTAICGKYVIAKPFLARGIIKSMGWKTTIAVLTGVAQSFVSLSRTTYQGQPALRAVLDFYAPGASIIMSATPQCYPLLVTDPGHFQLTFTHWNNVPTPVAPARRLIQTAPW